MQKTFGIICSDGIASLSVASSLDVEDAALVLSDTGHLDIIDQNQRIVWTDSGLSQPCKSKSRSLTTQIRTGKGLQHKGFYIIQKNLQRFQIYLWLYCSRRSQIILLSFAVFSFSFCPGYEYRTIANILSLNIN